MGKHGNGDNFPADGDRWPEDPADLPELPPLPDDVTVPDDPAALAEEAERLRAELARRRTSPDGLWDGATQSEPSLAMPLMIMSVAVLITLVSLFGMAWSGSQVDRTADQPRSLPDVILTDASGQATSVSRVGPVVIMMVESCDCSDLIAETVAAAPPGVTVLAVGSTAPAHPPGVAGGSDLRLLADPDGELRAALGLTRPYANTATVVLADQDRNITHTVPAATTISSFEDALATLTTRLTGGAAHEPAGDAA
jgi:hypothetical protein